MSYSIHDKIEEILNADEPGSVSNILVGGLIEAIYNQLKDEPGKVAKIIIALNSIEEDLRSIGAQTEQIDRKSHVIDFDGIMESVPQCGSEDLALYAPGSVLWQPQLNAFIEILPDLDWEHFSGGAEAVRGQLYRSGSDLFIGILRKGTKSVELCLLMSAADKRVLEELAAVPKLPFVEVAHIGGTLPSPLESAPGDLGVLCRMTETGELMSSFMRFSTETGWVAADDLNGSDGCVPTSTLVVCKGIIYSMKRYDDGPTDGTPMALADMEKVGKMLRDGIADSPDIVIEKDTAVEPQLTLHLKDAAKPGMAVVPLNAYPPDAGYVWITGFDITGEITTSGRWKALGHPSAGDCVRFAFNGLMTDCTIVSIESYEQGGTKHYCCQIDMSQFGNAQQYNIIFLGAEPDAGVCTALNNRMVPNSPRAASAHGLTIPAQFSVTQPAINSHWVLMLRDMPGEVFAVMVDDNGARRYGLYIEAAGEIHVADGLGVSVYTLREDGGVVTLERTDVTVGAGGDGTPVQRITEAEIDAVCLGLDEGPEGGEPITLAEIDSLVDEVPEDCPHSDDEAGPKREDAISIDELDELLK